MALLDTFLSAFKGGERSRVPLAPGMMQGWYPAFDTGPAPRSYEYARAVTEGFLANPIAQRSVRVVAEGVGQAKDLLLGGAVKAKIAATREFFQK
jgi:hypothetical protein